MEHGGLDLKRLRYFIAVCNSGGFTRASSAIGVAQPALTRQIQLLEKEVGLPLINRTTRGAEPTEQGLYLLERSRGHLDALDSIMRELRQKFSTPGGQVVLGICPTIAHFFLDDMIVHLRESHPNLGLSVIQAYSGDLQNLMNGDRLDIALTYLPADRSGVECIELFSERLVLVTGRQPHQESTPHSLAQLKRERLILPSRIHELRRIVDGVCRLRDIDLSPELELDSLDAVKAILMETSVRWSTILPFHSVKRECEDGQFSCFPFEDPAMQRTIAIVLPLKSRNSHSATCVASYIRERSEEIMSTIKTAL